jgi:hypothetical protein
VDCAARAAAVRRSGVGTRCAVTVLDAHATEEERDLCPAPIDLSEDVLEALGSRMVERIAELRQSGIHKLRVRGRRALLSALGG